MRSLPVILVAAIGACASDAPRPPAAVRDSAPPSAAAPPAGRSRLASCAPAPDGAWTLPAELAEVSGLAWDGDALLSHGDEVGRVYRVAPAAGAGLAATLRGEPRDDFEGIALAGDRLVLSTSAGRLYVAAWTGAGGVLEHRVIETGLGRECELEGLAWEAGSGTLLLPCKRPKGKRRPAGLVIRRWRLDPGAALPDVTIPAAAVAAAGIGGFRPSAIEVDPVTGDWLLLSANRPALLEVTPDGAVVRGTTLGRHHRQPEGLALTPSGDLLVADEAADAAPQLTRYRCPLP